MGEERLVGVVAELYRYPVKSMLGEHIAQARVEPRGVQGDRVWAVYTDDGAIGSGKTSRRFRRVDGLLHLRASLDAGVTRVHLGDGRVLPVEDPATADALTGLLGRALELRPEGDVPHHDDSPLHLVTTTSLRTLAGEVGHDVDVARFRPNLVVDTLDTPDSGGGTGGYPDDDWLGRDLAVGDEVVVRVDAGMPRCVMVTAAQGGLPRDPAVLTTLGRVRDVEFGVQASVVRGGVVRPGDPVRLLPRT